MKTSRPFLSLTTCAILASLLTANGAFAQRTQFQPRPPFQNVPANPCVQGSISLSAWTPLGTVYPQGGESVDVDVNDTTIQAMTYFTRADARPMLYLKVNIQLRGASGSRVREMIVLDGRGRFVRGGVTEGELRQNIDNYLESIPPRSAYALVEQHLRDKRCF